jgi:hypothetical protein
VHPGACLVELQQGDGVQQAPGRLGGRVPVAGLLGVSELCLAGILPYELKPSLELEEGTPPEVARAR